MISRLVLATAVAIAVCGVARSADAAVPTTMGFSAHLVGANGQPMAGQQSLTVSLFDAATDGRSLWSESFDATFLDGTSNLVLGATAPLDAAVFAGGKVFLEIKVGTVVMQPRLVVSSVPYAIRSSVAELAEGVAPGASITVATVAAQRVLEGGLGGSRYAPATSCADLHMQLADAPSGVYWVQPSSTTVPFRAYCDMTTDGGGWTLVWSNLRGGRSKPTNELQWNRATTTLPLVSGTLSSDLESFVVFTGLKHWVPLAPGLTLRYAWESDYGAGIQQDERCPFNLSGATYVLNVNAGGCAQIAGTVQAGLMHATSGNAFTAYDVDRDARPPNNCSSLYTSTPWWYGNCWNGSINGGGEAGSEGHFNGAYWVGSAAQWGDPAGVGAGNGWIYVR